MKITVDSTYFMKDLMAKAGRDYYSLDGYEFLLDYYDSLGDDIEFDAVAISCEWNEYGNGVTLGFNSFLSDYGYLAECGGWSYNQLKDLTDDEISEAVDELVDALEDKTTAVKLSNGNVMVLEF